MYIRFKARIFIDMSKVRARIRPLVSAKKLREAVADKTQFMLGQLKWHQKIGI